MSHVLRLLAALHARGFHAAVLAGLILMPAVVAAGFWSGESMPGPATLPGLGDLRGPLDPPTPSLRPGLPD